MSPKALIPAWSLTRWIDFTIVVALGLWCL